MADLNYTHSLTGRGVGAGLPLMPGSELYNVQPQIRYPLVLTTGVTRETGQYTTYLGLRTPHEPVIGQLDPYVNNHKAGGSFLRYQYFTVKRGQPVMVTDRRSDSVGVFVDDGGGSGEYSGVRYADPVRFARPKINGYAGLSYDPGTGTTTPTTISVAAFEALSAEDQAAGNYKPTYGGDTDTNDAIVTGGEDLSVKIEEALLGSSARPKFVKTDIEGYYGGLGVKFDGFMRRSSGGFPRTEFFTSRDQAAGVVLPTNGSDVSRVVTPLATADVTAANFEAYKDSAIIVQPGKTVGVSHTDLEQTLNLRHYRFQTGMEPRGFISKGKMQLPFVDIEKLHGILAAKLAGSDYSALHFTDQTNNRSGAKVGVDMGALTVDVQNKYSLLTGKDSGYAHLLNSFWAPFATFTTAPEIDDVLVPDLFGNYTRFGTGALGSGATEGTAGDGNDFTLLAADVAKNLDGAMTANSKHKIGYVANVRTIEKQDIMDQVVNPLWQVRLDDGISRQISHGYNRVTGADTRGIAPMLTDFAWMLLGGSNTAWASAFMPTYDGVNQDLAFVIEDLIYEGALGVIEVILDTSIAK